MTRPGPADQRRHLLGRLTMRGIQHVVVAGVDAGVGVACLAHPDVVADLRVVHQRDGGVPPALVQGDHWHPGLRGELAGPAGDVAGPPRRAVEPAEHQAMVSPVGSRAQPGGELGLAVLAQQGGGGLVQVHPAHPGAGLGHALGQVAVQFEDRVIDHEHPGIGVGAGPPQPAQLAAAQPAQDGQPEQQAQLIALGGG